MGSLIKGVLFMPPNKAPAEDENKTEKQKNKEKEEENKNTVFLDTAHGSKIKLIRCCGRIIRILPARQTEEITNEKNNAFTFVNRNDNCADFLQRGEKAPR